jgi:ADP-ribose pyrophosphatase
MTLTTDISIVNVKTLESKIVYQNKWMTVKEDLIQRENGTMGIYGIVEKPDFAVIAAIENGKVCLVEQHRYPVASRFWELPQGSWESSSISACDLAKAELREETGIIAHSMEHIGHLFLAYGYSNQGYNVFMASALEHASQDLDTEEHGLAARFFSISDVESMIVQGNIKDATTVAAFGLLKLRKKI